MIGLSSFRTFSPLVLCVAVLFLVSGCGGGDSGPDVQIQQGERSPAIEGATARVTTPADSAVLDSADVDIVVEADSFETGIQTDTERAEEIANSANGQHFHVILDNQPYMANYEAGTPFDIGTLEPGPHTLVVLPSRSYHESVKRTDAYDVVNFYVQDEGGTFMLNPEEPAIIYSRPKGTYSGAGAERIMLDFYLHNVELSEDGYKARYIIRSPDADGQELPPAALTDWAPAFVTGLESGTYTVQLQLLNADGDVVPGAFNDTTREIQVETE